MVESEIKACLDGKLPNPRSASPLPKVGSDVTLTKVPGPLSEVKQSNEVEIKKTENPIGLPNFGSLKDKPRSEGSESLLAFGKTGKTMAAPRENDDYEDRSKKIISSELAKSGDKMKSPNIEEISSDDDNEQVEINQEDCELLVYPPTKNFHENRITIKRRDFNTLSRGKYIVDTIVDFYYRHLYENLPSETKNKVYICKTDLYQWLRMPGGLDDIISWKQVNLYEKEFILFPICWNGHYSLFIIIR